MEQESWFTVKARLLRTAMLGSSFPSMSRKSSSASLSSLSSLGSSLCNRLVFFFLLIRLHLILSYVVSYLRVLSYSSLDLCLMLCMLPPLVSYSLAPSSIMMSCTVHSHTPLMYSGIYTLQSSTQILPFPQSLFVVVCPWCLPWVASLELESNHLTCP